VGFTAPCRSAHVPSELHSPGQRQRVTPPSALEEDTEDEIRIADSAGEHEHSAASGERVDGPASGADFDGQSGGDCAHRHERQPVAGAGKLADRRRVELVAHADDGQAEKSEEVQSIVRNHEVGGGRVEREHEAEADADSAGEAAEKRTVKAHAVTVGPDEQDDDGRGEPDHGGRLEGRAEAEQGTRGEADGDEYRSERAGGQDRVRERSRHVRDEKSGEEPKADRKDQQGSRAGGEQVRGAGRVPVQEQGRAGVRRQRLPGADGEVGEDDRDEQVRRAVDRPAVGVVVAGARLAPERVVPERCAHRRQEDGDAGGPRERADTTSHSGNAVEGCECEAARSDDGERGVARNGAGPGQVPVEVGGDQRVGLPEDDVEDEPVQAERHPGPSREGGDGGRLPDDEKADARRDEDPRIP